MARAFPVLALVMLVVLVGCGQGGAPAAGQAGDLRKTVDGLTVSVALTPSPPAANKDVAARVTLADNKGQAVPDARVVATLEAGGMTMMPYTVTAQAQAGGRYTATLKPTGMAGAHSLTIDVTWQNKAYQAKFDGIRVA